MLHHKCCIFILILLLLFIYIYVKKENFNNSTDSKTPNNTVANTVANTITYQVTNEIAKVLKISPERIKNLKVEGDIRTNILNVDFSISDGSAKHKTEKSKKQAEKLALSLVSSDTFFISINSQAIKLRKIVVIKAESAFFDNSVFFKNEGLKEISKYSNNKYVTAPNDEALTKFYTLEVDNEYKVTPKLK
jgi:hypothetical protein